jgi:hypothetical protein
MTHSGIAALLVVVVGIALTGCAQDVGEAPPDPEATNRTTTSEAPSGTTKPPHSTLILGKHTVAGVHGSYCWESASGANEAVSRCADAAGIPVPPVDEALTVPRGWVVVFDYGGRGRPASVDAGTYLLGRGSELRDTPSGLFLSPTEGPSASETEELRVSRLGDRAQIPVGLPEGEYVIKIFVRVPEGDAAYYFRVVVV